MSQKITDSQEGVVTVSGSMTIYEAAPLRETFLEALTAKGGLHLDFGGITEIDTAGVQLVCAAKISAAAAGASFDIVAASEAVRKAFSLAGFDPTEWIENAGEV